MRAAEALARVEPYGFIVIVVLLVTGLLGDLLRPLYRVALELLYALTGL
jgi:hypothetical protein